MITIYKYPAPIDDEFTVMMPEGAEVLTVQMQGKSPQIWARVDIDKPLRFRAFHWRGTGHDAAGLGRYVGTIQDHWLVFHLFEGATA